MHRSACPVRICGPLREPSAEIARSAARRGLPFHRSRSTWHPCAPKKPLPGPKQLDRGAPSRLEAQRCSQLLCLKSEGPPPPPCATFTHHLFTASPLVTSRAWRTRTHVRMHTHTAAGAREGKRSCVLHAGQRSEPHLLRQCATTARGAWFCLLCRQPEPFPRTLVTRLPQLPP